MIGWQGMLASGLVAAVVAGGIGWQARGVIDSAECDKRVNEVKEAAAKLIDKKDGEMTVLRVEKAQAQAEVAKVNAETMRQLQELQTLLAADRVKRDEASARVEKAAQQAAANAKEAAAKALAAREVIQNVTDQCARAGVPNDVVRVLNDILGAPTP